MYRFFSLFKQTVTQTTNEVNEAMDYASANNSNNNDNKIQGDFKMRIPLTERQRLSSGCLQSNLKLLPLIIENTRSAPPLKKKEFAIKETMTFFQLKYFIMKALKAQQPHDSNLHLSTLIVSVSSCKYLPCNNEFIKDLYDKYKDIDGFLYLTYTTEVAYG